MKMIKAISFAIMLSLLASTPLAANLSEMSTVVTYTKIEPTVTAASPSPSPSPSPTPAAYVINIPASISLNEVRNINITANQMSLNEGQKVVVSIDAKSYSGGYIWLENPNTPGSIGNRIGVWVERVKGNIQANPGDAVAIFNNSETIPSYEGVLRLGHTDVSSIPPGTYTGTMYFKIAIVES